MNLIELVATLLCFTTFSLGMGPHFIKLYETFCRTAELNADVSRDTFIVEKFRKVCRSNSNEKSLEERLASFTELCRSMWSFDEFSICLKNQHMPDEREYGSLCKTPSGRLFYASWKVGSRRCEVYCREGG